MNQFEKFISGLFKVSGIILILFLIGICVEGLNLFLNSDEFAAEYRIPIFIVGIVFAISASIKYSE